MNVCIEGEVNICLPDSYVERTVFGGGIHATVPLNGGLCKIRESYASSRDYVSVSGGYLCCSEHTHSKAGFGHRRESSAPCAPFATVAVEKKSDSELAARK